MRRRNRNRDKVKILKVCKVCNREKRLKQMQPSSLTPTGASNVCKVCYNKELNNEATSS